MSASSSLRGTFGRLSTSIVSGVFSSSTTVAPDPRLSGAATEIVLRSTLAKLTKTLSARKYKPVRDVAQQQLDLLESLVKDESVLPKRKVSTVIDDKTSSNEGESLAEVSATPGKLGSLLQSHAREFFEPFRLACETKSPRAILVALDGLQV